MVWGDTGKEKQTLMKEDKEIHISFWKIFDLVDERRIPRDKSNPQRGEQKYLRAERK